MKQETKQQDGPQRLYSMNQVATLWGISRWTIYAMIKKGKVKPIVGIGKGYKWKGDELANVEFERL